MAGHDWLGEQFESYRTHLRAVAYRMLGSQGDAEDAVQEAWLRLSRSDPEAIDNLGGWLTTVVARVSLDMLRKRGSRREEPADTNIPDRSLDFASDPECPSTVGATRRPASTKHAQSFAACGRRTRLTSTGSATA